MCSLSSSMCFTLVKDICTIHIKQSSTDVAGKRSLLYLHGRALHIWTLSCDMPLSACRGVKTHINIFFSFFNQITTVDIRHRACSNRTCDASACHSHSWSVPFPIGERRKRNTIDDGVNMQQERVL